MLPSWWCMRATSGVRRGPDRTHALLEQIIGGARGAQLHAKLADANPSAPPELIEEAFQEACIRADRLCHRQTEGEVYVGLHTTAHREIGHIRARTEHEVPVDTSGSGFDPADPATLAPVDELIKRRARAAAGPARLLNVLLNEPSSSTASTMRASGMSAARVIVRSCPDTPAPRVSRSAHLRQTRPDRTVSPT